MVRFLINPISYHEVLILERSSNEQVVNILALIEVGVRVLDCEVKVFCVGVEPYLCKAFFEDHFIKTYIVS